MKICTGTNLFTIDEGISISGMIQVGLDIQNNDIIHPTTYKDTGKKIPLHEGTFDVSTMKRSIFYKGEKVSMIECLSYTTITKREKDQALIHSHLFTGVETMLEYLMLLELGTKKPPYNPKELEILESIVEGKMMFSQEYRRGIDFILQHNSIKDIATKNNSKEFLAGIGMAIGILHRNKKIFLKLFAQIQYYKNLEAPHIPTSYGF